MPVSTSWRVRQPRQPEGGKPDPFETIRHRGLIRGALALAAGLATCMLFASGLRAQVSDPAAVVEAYYAALKAGDLPRAASYVQTLPSEVDVGRAFDNVESDAAGQSPRSYHKTPSQECESNLKNMATAVEMYSTDFSGRFPREISQVTPDYVKTLPTCPAAAANTYSYTVSADPDGYTFVCAGANHTADGVAPNFPQYTMAAGLLTERVEGAISRPPSPWAVLSYRVLEASVQGDAATVRVDETYGVHGFPTRVLASIPLRRVDGAWRIASTALPMKEVENMPRGWWMRVHGLGETFAGFVAWLGTAEGRLSVMKGLVIGCKSNLKNIGTALEMYSTDNAGRFPKSLSPLTPNYLKLWPTCPAAGSDTYSDGFQSSSHPDAYTVVCGGSNHTRAGMSANFPQYTSTEGLIER